MQLDNPNEIEAMNIETEKEIAGLQSETSRQYTRDRVSVLDELLGNEPQESTGSVGLIMGK